MSVLTFAEDFSQSSVTLDSTLRGASDSGLFWNRGVHPIVNIDNILEIAPLVDFTPTAYNASTTYSIFETTFELSNIVTYNSKIYESLTDSNTGNTPSSNPSNWLETNIESLRIKSMIHSSKQNMIAAINMSRSLIENQFIYESDDSNQEDYDLPNDYSGWAFEPKGSDYVRITFNQMSLKANTTDPQSIYVVNQGRLITTLTLNPNNGVLEFEDVGYSITGKGVFYFLFDSQNVKTNNAYVDALKYNSFVCYPVTATGTTPEGSDISLARNSNGLNFNISTSLNSEDYINNNLVNIARLWQLQFAYDLIRTYLYNPNIRSNNNQRTINGNLLQVDALDTNLNTLAKQYEKELYKVKNAINMTFDRFLKVKKSVTIKEGTV